MSPGSAVVADASVVVKWLVQEEFSERAEALLIASARRSIVGPPHLASEVTNALFQRLRRRDLTEAEAEHALAEFLGLRIQLLQPEDIYQQAFAFARTHRLPNTYDSLYVVLAQILSTELWTADTALLTTVGHVAPWIRWIGQYPLLSES